MSEQNQLEDNNMINFWQMQLHPSKPDWSITEIDNILMQYSVIGMGDEWDNDGGAPIRFKKDMSIGDIVVIRHQGSPRYLVEVTSHAIKNEGNNQIDVWFEIYRKVRILSNEGVKFKSLYKKAKNKNWSDGLFAPTTFQTANDWDFAHYWYNQIKKKETMKRYNLLLKSNHNLILTGAPGTGKTYLAKQIAAELLKLDNVQSLKGNKHFAFVQFHPSYDYTDFVEGLRPIYQNESGEIGFERRDGIFKEFCKRAALDSKQEVSTSNVPYVFVIDEINRGELSKIFGELFFSIDPGYRGTEGSVITQYQKLVGEDDIFAEGFYIPENVYIIGTMNDIDRSVESMDFAMRRRFAWKEVTATDSYQNMIEGSPDFTDAEKAEIKYRMENLNQTILKSELGLGEAFQIGAAYFRKFLNYKELGIEEAFTMLWDNHLSGLLFEYLRGNKNAQKQLDELKDAYNKKPNVE